MSKLQIRTPEAYAPFLRPSRYKGAWGGRGSGKSHNFSEMLIEHALMHKGTRAVCIREVQKSLKESSKRLLEDKLIKFGVGEKDGFKVFREVIETPGGGVVTFTGMQDHTADSIKSLEGFSIAWCAEAQSMSDRSLTLLRPTIRAPGSELWFDWNPQRPTDPIDRLLRSVDAPTDAIVIKANWRDNPWFPAELEQERQDCLRLTPERYGHIWEGEYATVLEGAYYAKFLNDCELQGRIGFVARDPLLKVYTFWDIGSTSKTADAVTIWVVQFVGAEIRVLDYYEAVGQEFSAHVNWLRSNGLQDCICVLPHDGRKHDVVYRITPQGALGEAGFLTEVVQNQGAGAALLRVDASRRMFPSVRFNRETTQHGREALGWYHEKRDENRNMGLGPEHDWSSNGADSFGLLAVYHGTTMQSVTGWGKPMRRNLKGIA